MKRKTLLSPLFFVSLIFIMLNIKNVSAAPVLLAEKPANYVSAYNPVEIYVYNKAIGANILINVISYGSGTQNRDAQIYMYNVNTSMFIYSLTITIDSNGYVFGHAVYEARDTSTYAPLDGFYFVAGYCKQVSGYVNLFVKAYFINVTNNGATTLGEVAVSTSDTGVYTVNRAIFSNQIWFSGYTIASLTLGDVRYAVSTYRTFTCVFVMTTTTIQGKWLIFSNPRNDRYGITRVSGSTLNPNIVIFYGALWSNDLSTSYLYCAAYDIATNTITQLAQQGANYYQYQPRLYQNATLIKYKGIQNNPISSTNEAFKAYFSACKGLQTEMTLETVNINMESLTFISSTLSIQYKITGIVLNSDMRSPYTTITKNYYYQQSSTSIFSAAYNEATGSVVMEQVNLGLTPNEQTYIIGQYTFFMITPDAKIRLYSTQKITEVTIEPPPPPLPPPEDTSFVDVGISVLVTTFALPFMFIITPAALLGVTFKNTAGIVVGLCVGVGLAAACGLIPFWIVILVALGVLLLLVRGGGSNG